MVNPDNIFGLLNKHADKVALQIIAVLGRLILGALLIYQAGASKHPLVIEMIGWLSILAAISFTVIGRHNFRRLISWALSLAKPFGRIGGVLAGCFGAFLIYAFV